MRRENDPFREYGSPVNCLRTIAISSVNGQSERCVPEDRGDDDVVERFDEREIHPSSKILVHHDGRKNSFCFPVAPSYRKRRTETKVFVIIAYEDLIIGHGQNLERPEATAGNDFDLFWCNPNLGA